MNFTISLLSSPHKPALLPDTAETLVEFDLYLADSKFISCSEGALFVKVNFEKG